MTGSLVQFHHILMYKLLFIVILAKKFNLIFYIRNILRVNSILDILIESLNTLATRTNLIEEKSIFLSIKWIFVI